MSRKSERGSGRVGKVGGCELGRWERCEGSVLERWERWHRWEASWVARLERLEGSDMASWERWGGGGGGSEEVARWERCKDSEVAKWQGGRFLVLFKSGGHRVSHRLHLFVSDVDQQQNKGAG